MMYVTTLDVMGLTPFEYRAVLDKMGVERRPAKNIFLHVTTPIEGGYRILEIWDSQEGFEEFLKNRLGPANEELGLERATTISVTPLRNLFAPRLQELPAIVDSLPGSPAGSMSSR